LDGNRFLVLWPAQEKWEVRGVAPRTPPKEGRRDHMCPSMPSPAMVSETHEISSFSWNHESPLPGFPGSREPWSAGYTRWLALPALPTLLSPQCHAWPAARGHRVTSSQKSFLASGVQLMGSQLKFQLGCVWRTSLSKYILAPK
jgi:hypothetical protein